MLEDDDVGLASWLDIVPGSIGKIDHLDLDLDLDLELALLLEDAGDLLRLLLLALPLSFVDSARGLPSGLAGSSLVCKAIVTACMQCRCNITSSGVQQS